MATDDCVVMGEVLWHGKGDGLDKEEMVDGERKTDHGTEPLRRLGIQLCSVF